jgi:trigger factor
MQVKIIPLSETKITALVMAGAGELEPIKKRVLQKFNTPSLKIPGFRGGKAPLNVVEKNLDPNVLQAEFLEEAINDLYVAAAKQEQFRPVAPPQISLKKFVPFTDLEFEGEIDVIGKIVLPKYEKIRKSRPTVSVAAKDIEGVLNDLKTRAADKKDVDRAAKSGDQVFIDFKGVDDKGAPVNGAEGKDYPLVLGSNSFIPGFEDNVIGMKANEEKTFTLEFPKDYGVKALAKKKVTFTVNATKVQEIAEPKFDNDFAAKVGPFKDMAELKEDIKKQLFTEKQNQADRNYENELIQEIVSKTKMQVPALLIEDQLDRSEQEEKQNLMYRGQTWEEHLKDEGVNAEEHRTKKRPEAEERVKTGLVLAEIAEKEKLEISPEELEIRIQLLKGQYQDKATQDELDKPENRRDIASRMLAEKTVEKLVSYAVGK